MSIVERERDWCEQRLAEGEIGWLAVNGDDGPYLIPLNYHWHAGRVLIHTALHGRKLEHLRRDPRVCFGVGSAAAPATPHGSGGCYLPWRSVLVEGRADLVEDAAEKLPLLQAFLEAYDPQGEHDPLTAADVERTLLIVIRPEVISGREELGTEAGGY
jgi:hypothetical protein